SRADLRPHGDPELLVRRRRGHDVLDRAWCVSAERNGPDVRADERIPCGALAETDLPPTKRYPSVIANGFWEGESKRIQYVARGINRMRKIIEYCLVSADGIVLHDPFPFRDYDDDAYLWDRLGTFAACDAILWGRTTYERFAKRSPGGERIPPYAARLNAIRKYVFSSKLETAEWNNSTIVRGDVAAEVTKLKQQDG